MLKRVLAILLACVMLLPSVTIATPYASSIPTQTLTHLKAYMNRYEKTKFNAVIKVGNIDIYKAALADVQVVIDSKLKTKAMYDADNNKLLLQKHPAKVSKTESVGVGEAVWSSLTRKIENEKDEMGALEGQAYVERNVKYMTYVIKNALPVLEKMEVDKKADAAKLTKYWDLFIKKMDEASALPEVKQYAVDSAALQDWFGYKVSSDDILSHYLNGAAGVNIKTALAGKVMVNWSGTWNTEFGVMTLKQTGSKVTGQYEYGDGVLNGSVSGGKLSGNWKENDDEGTFEFLIANDGQSFTGTWAETKPDPSSNGTWDGERSKPGAVTQPQPQPPSMPEPLADWTGTWQTDYGVMILKQTGNSVTGSYAHQEGTVSGIASGYTFTGTWKESDDEGTMTFTIAADGKSFTGTWVETKPSPSQPASWNGQRQADISAAPAPAPAPVPPSKPQFDWSGLWRTDYGNMTLTQVGDQITGTYESQEGKVNGTVNGNVFSGTWKETDDEGTFVFTLSSDERSFTGTWKETSPNPNSGGAWNGKR